MSLTWGKLEIKQKLILLGVVSLLAVGLTTLLLILPQLERLEQARAQYQQELRQVQVVEAFVRTHPDTDRYLAELDQKAAALSRGLPENVALGDYLAQLETVANISGVKLVQVKPSPPADKGGYQEIQLAVTVKGGFFQLLNFVKVLDGGPRFCAITKVSVQSQQGGLESQLAVNIYSLRR